MSKSSLQQFCDLVSTVSLNNAIVFQESFANLFEENEKYDRTYVIKSFAFMNYTFAVGVWSNLRNEQLRRDLIIQLKLTLILQLGNYFAPTLEGDEFAATCALLNEEFDLYLVEFKEGMKLYSEHSKDIE